MGISYLPIKLATKGVTVSAMTTIHHVPWQSHLLASTGLHLRCRTGEIIRSSAARRIASGGTVAFQRPGGLRKRLHCFNLRSPVPGRPRIYENLVEFNGSINLVGCGPLRFAMHVQSVG